jgi:DNA-binding winged helix-turn-helix (wHTH) protein/TolB-like protein
MLNCAWLKVAQGILRMGEAPEDDRPYLCGDVVVDPRAHRLVRAGADVAIEPKAFAVLLVLLREAGGIVPRDALLDEVWGHRHVTPAVLNRVIAMLRRALGDDAEHPRLIRTVYGTGYGFIGAVSRAEAPVATASPPPPAATDPATHASVREPSPAPSAAPARTNPPAVHRSRLAITGLLALAVLIGGWIWRAGTGDVEPLPVPKAPTVPSVARQADDGPTPASTASAPLRVAVLPLRAESPGEAAGDLAAGLTDGLIESLSRQPRIAVMSRESSERVDATDPGAALQALGVDRVVAGRLTLRDDGSVVVDITLHRAPGSPTWTQTYERPRAQVFRLLGPLLDDLRGEALPIGSEAAMRALRGASERVQDLYGDASLQFTRLLRGGRQANAEPVLVAIDRLIAEDPEFAPGHAMRALLFTRQGNIGAIDLGTAAVEARAAAERAIALDPDLLDGHVAAGFAATMQWRVIEALGPAQRALELAPNDYRALSLMGNVLAYTGQVDEAYAYAARADALNPLVRQVMVRHGWSKVLGGDRDEALADLDALEREIGRIPFGSRTRILVAFGEPGRALSIEGQPMPGEAAVAGFARAAALQLLGEFAAASTELARIAPRLPTMPLYLNLRLREALLAGDAAGFVTRLDSVTSPPAQSPWLEAVRAKALAEAGDRDAALRAFGRVFGEPRNREVLVYSWFATGSGISFLADWIALRRAAGMSHAAELAAHDAFLQRFIDGGVKAPMLAYHRAVAAALHGDTSTADRLLGEAIEAGWLDPVSLRFDLAWAPHANEPWLEKHRDEIATRVQAQRRLAGMR